MLRSRKWLLDLGALAVLLVLPLILFWPVALGSRTLIPADNLYQWEPYKTFARQQAVPLPPHNELLSDLVLENLVWKQFIVESLQAGDIPLWNPHLFAGVPFLAAGQHSALYPLSALFYLLPLVRAYGLFTVLQLWLAGVFMYLFGRVLRLGRFPALVAGITYQLSAFFLVSVVFTMILAAAAWLPLLLAVIEVMIRKQEDKGTGPFVPIVYVIVGAMGLGVHVLAGHPEILVYTLVVMAYYTLIRLALLWRRVGSWKPALRLATNTEYTRTDTVVIAVTPTKATAKMGFVFMNTRAGDQKSIPATKIAAIAILINPPIVKLELINSFGFLASDKKRMMEKFRPTKLSSRRKFTAEMIAEP